MYTIIVFIPKPQKFKLSMGVTVVSRWPGAEARAAGWDRTGPRAGLSSFKFDSDCCRGGPPAGGLGGAACRLSWPTGSEAGPG